MRNHAFLYLIPPDGAAGELDLVAESNSTWPAMWQVLFARTTAVAAEMVERVFEHPVLPVLATDALSALHRYERVTRFLLAQPQLAAMADVGRYLAAAQTHLRASVQAHIVPDGPAPLFCVDLHEFAQKPEVIRANAAQWWQQFEAIEHSPTPDALEWLCAIDGSRRRLDQWRTWAEAFGLALFAHPHFAASFRAPRAEEFVPAPEPCVPAGEHVWPHCHGYAVVLRNDRYGYIDVRGNELTSVQFDEADDFSAYGLARVGRQRRYGLLRTDGTYALPIEYDELQWCADLEGWLCRRAGACALLNADGSQRLDSTWDEIDILAAARLLRVRRGKHVGVIDAHGVQVVPVEFANIEQLEPHTKGSAGTPTHGLRVHSQPQRSRSKAGVWDVAAGRLIVPCEYDFVWSMLIGPRGQHGFLVAIKIAYAGTPRADRYRVGVLDESGRVLVPMEYAWIGAKADLSKSDEFERTREALFWAWSRNQPVPAGLPDSDAAVWIASDGTRLCAPEVVRLPSPNAKPSPMSALIAAAFYRFVELPDYTALRSPLLERCEALNIKGTILLAAEGINGTIAGEAENVRALLQYLRSDPRLAALEHKESPARATTFYRMKVRLKREIVTLGVAEVNAARMAGTYVKPEDWNALISDPDVVVIDARNDYEVALGTFARALNPGTRSFRELPQWLRAQPQLEKKPKVAMFCTGGIRCEKSTAFLRSEGFEQVYHLQGGILKYLEAVPPSQSLWQGECFVFDERVAIGHGLAPGVHELCRSCREPVGPADKTSEFYVEGVSCPKCFHQRSDEKKRGLLERQRQVELARRRNDSHIGVRQELKRAAKRRRRAS